MMMAIKTRFSLFHVALLLVLLITVAMFAKTIYDKATASAHMVTHEGVVTDIQKLARLQSVAFSVDAIITANKSGTWQRLWQDGQKGLFVAHGRVLAGVDLSKITPNMVQVTHKQDDHQSITHITITMPPSEVFDVYVDVLEVYDWQTGLFGAMSNDAHIFSQAQESAKTQVLNKACQGDVMAMAANNAAEQIKGLFVLTGAKVDVVGQNVGACQFMRR
ncbi:DUF4230 domain-containing protein [Moraxella sp. Tifton1]|uniref:DUF4230 domain-containing protein n=1 Tax=Moraxella oculi TaxID=2940516 RepID=UPI002010FE6F|nr:DUF4230 domain-containing protein [Moraxella sp. Tifton1]MCL1622918.1 DUF4230 domain-containing protein [Moraxella sp. Tifton1]